MILGIDASNIRSGGTVTHLIELLRAADPLAWGFTKVIVWGGSAVLSTIEERSWLVKAVEPMLEQSANPFRDRNHLRRAYWQRFRLAKLARLARCDALFVPGGLGLGGFEPMIAMSQNMLPFDASEGRRYGISASRARLLLLRIGQSRTFRRARGVIFLTHYARDSISQVVSLDFKKTTIVPHGIGGHFFAKPRQQRAIADCSASNAFRLLYVSTVDFYKHQWNVAEATALLRQEGLPVTLDMVGPANGKALRRLEQTLARIDPAGKFIRYLGSVAYERQRDLYMQADVGVFASSCENLPIILLEGMAAGLPMACSNRGPMSEVLGEAGVYFDPERVADIAAGIRSLIESPQTRSRNAALGFQRAQEYAWTKCAQQTFAFLAGCARPAGSP